jgi:hypothetical protein
MKTSPIINPNAFTIYRGKLPRGGFRVVKGGHDPLPEAEYTAYKFDDARAAFVAATPDERGAVLRIAPDAESQPGTWVRVDKGDGATTDIDSGEVFAMLHAAQVFKTGAELRRRMSAAEAGGTSRKLETDYARYEFKPWLSVTRS